MQRPPGRGQHEQAVRQVRLEALQKAGTVVNQVVCVFCQEGGGTLVRLPIFNSNERVMIHRIERGGKPLAQPDACIDVAVRRARKLDLDVVGEIRRIEARLLTISASPGSEVMADWIRNSASEAIQVNTKKVIEA